MPGLLDALMPASPGEAAETRIRRHRCARVALLAAAACFTMGVALVITMPKFVAADERAHLAYTASVLEGRLPDVDDPFPDGQFDSLDRLTNVTPEHGDVWVGNHPPLMYVLAAPLAWLAEKLEIDAGPLLVMRVLSAAAMAVGVALSASIAYELLPRREVGAAGTALLVGATAQVQHGAALAYIDGLAFATSMACLVVALRLLRRGPSRGLLIAGLVAGALAAASRVAALPAVALLVVAWCVACLRADPPSERRTLVGGTGALVAAPAVAAGWFYLLNRSRYGSFSGAGHLLDKFDRQPRGTTWSIVTDPDFGLKLIERLWTVHQAGVDICGGCYVTGFGQPLEWPAAIPFGIAALALAGWVVAAVRSGGLPRPSTEDALVAGMGLVWCGIVVVAMASFVADGGGVHPRYVFGALPFLLAFVAGGLCHLAPRALALAAAVAVLLGVDLLLVRDLRDYYSPENVSQSAGDPAFQALGYVRATAVVLVVLAVAAFAVALVALVRAARSDSASREPAVTPD